jgi:hypothetical protein
MKIIGNNNNNNTPAPVAQYVPQPKTQAVPKSPVSPEDYAAIAAAASESLPHVRNLHPNSRKHFVQYVKGQMKTHARMRKQFVEKRMTAMDVRAMPMTSPAPGVLAIGDPRDPIALVQVEGISRKHVWKRGEHPRKDVNTILMAQSSALSAGGPKISMLRPSQWDYKGFDGKTEFLQKKNLPITIHVDAIQDILLPEFKERVASGEIRSIESFIKGSFSVVKDVKATTIKAGVDYDNPKTGVVTTYVLPPEALKTRLNGEQAPVRWLGTLAKVGMSFAKGFLGSMGRDGQVPSTFTTQFSEQTIVHNGQTMYAVNERFDPELFERFNAIRASGKPVRINWGSIGKGILGGAVSAVSSLFGRDVDPKMISETYPGVTYLGPFGDDHLVSLDLDEDDYEIGQGASIDSVGDKGVGIIYENNPPGGERVGNSLVFEATNVIGVDESPVSEYEVIEKQSDHLVGSAVPGEEVSVVMHSVDMDENVGFEAQKLSLGSTGFDSSKPTDGKNGKPIAINFNSNSLVQGYNSTVNSNNILSATPTAITAVATRMNYNQGSKLNKDLFAVAIASDDAPVTDIVSSDSFEVTNWDKISSGYGYASAHIEYTGGRNSAIRGPVLETDVDLYFGQNMYTKIVATPTDTVYMLNQEFDKSKLNVVGYYEDGETDEIATHLIQVVSGFDSSSIGPKQVRIKYHPNPDEGFPLETTCEVKVINPIVDLSVTINRVLYNQYDQFKPEDIVVMGILAIKPNTGSQSVVLDITKYEVQSFRTDTIGKFTVYITYSGEATLSTSYDILVVNGTHLSSRAVLDRTTYFKGEAFDKSSAHVFSMFSGLPDEFEIPGVMFELDKWDSSKTGTVTLNFKSLPKYSNFNLRATAEVTILADSIKSIEAIVEPGYECVVGSAPDSSKITVQSVSATGKKEVVTSWSLKGFNPVEDGAQTVTIEAAGLTTTAIIVVVKPVITTVAVKALETKFVLGEPINKNLIQVIGSDALGFTRELEPSEFTIEIPPIMTPDDAGTVVNVVVPLPNGGELAGRFTAFFTHPEGKATETSMLVIVNDRPYYTVGSSFDPLTIRGYRISSKGERTEVPIEIENVGDIDLSTSGEKIITVYEA